MADKLSPTVRRLLAGFAVATLFCIYAVEVTRASRDLSVTWDEPTHIMAGYRYWQASDYGLNPEHPPLAKLVGALPLLLMHLRVPKVGRDCSKPMVVIQGRALVYQNDADTLLLGARLAEAVVGLCLVLLLFEAGYRMFGLAVGWIAAVVAVFEPNLLAHSTLVTTDFALTCFLFASVYAFWRLAEQPSLLRLVSCGMMSGLALASKHSAILLPPILAMLAAVEIYHNVKSAEGRAPGQKRALGHEITRWTGRLLVIGGIATLVLWAFYGFRYPARPDGLPLPVGVGEYTRFLKGHFAPWSINTAARYKLLPESYLFGLVDVLVVTGGPRMSFLLGRLYPHALWYYFPVCFVIKSTLGFLVLLILSIVVVRKWSGEGHRKAAYLLIPPAFFMAVSLTSGTNMGIRHILPVYPFLILAAAAGAWVLAKRHKAWAIAIAALVVFHLASSLHTLPDYLAYSNELFGGTSRTYLSLSDSNVDWGQGIREAAKYLEKRHIKDCWLAYFGTADPAYYHLPCKPLPDPFLRWWGEPIPVPPEKYHGVVLISATEIAAPYWGKGPINPYDQFLDQKPTDNIGGSVLVYEGDVDLRRPSAFGHMYHAWDLIKVKNQEGAIQEALKAGELAPDHPGPAFIVGYILAQQHRTEAARIQLEESLRLAEAAYPDYQPLWVMTAKSELATLP
ncbi:MAG TPA: glycosyltransferase family 39 protein [Terriglobia bacterium]|nr:glycosyltransferase family 39 protein [Terriglobia bacterium]